MSNRKMRSNKTQKLSNCKTKKKRRKRSQKSQTTVCKRKMNFKYYNRTLEWVEEYGNRRGSRRI